jgi:hypothetical protein
MKKNYTLLCSLLFFGFVHAQIPNAGFENWSGGLPVGWWGQNDPDTLFVQSSQAHSGNSALRMNVANGGIPYGGYIYSGDSADTYFSISSPPGALYGWYIANIADSGDVLTINSSISTDTFALGISLGVGVTEATAVYKQFVFNYSYLGNDLGHDSASIEFGIQNQGSAFLTAATYFIIDDLSFGDSVSTTGITPVIVNAAIEQCVPNPTSGSVNVIYTLDQNSTASVNLYDLTGRLVKVLLSNTKQTPGRYKIPTDVSDLPAAVYICRLNANGLFYDNKLVVVK